MDTSRSRHQRKSSQDDLLKQKGLEIHGVLSSGRFGSFLLARQKKEAVSETKHEFVSITSYHKSVLHDTYQQHIPLREIKLLKSFDHPMITNVLSTFSDRNCLYVMSPLEVGGPLSHLLQNALTLGITDDVKNFYAACVVSVLKYAHNQDIIHRGIHPDSLLIDGSGYLKVTDWGFAKHVVDRTYTLCGHVEYLCPEAIFHDSGYGKGADYWALGVLIYEMYVGRSAFAPGSLDFKYDAKFDDRVVISTGTESSCNYMTPQREMNHIQESLSSSSLTGLDRTSSPSLSQDLNKNNKGLKANDYVELKDIVIDYDDCII
jgi:serine/threonine protein kinase